MLIHNFGGQVQVVLETKRYQFEQLDFHETREIAIKITPQLQ